MNLRAYENFVAGTISKPSSNFPTLIERLNELDSNTKGVKIPELLTAAVGLTAESGEFTEIVKKIVFQGKELTDDNVFHLCRELGDIMWYVAVACQSLNIPLAEIIEMNVDKLSARYPDGFEVYKSENRKIGDI